MEKKQGKFFFQPNYERLEVYLLAADDPTGKRQLRPIFRRKRSREVLTREQVTAIKRGRRVLRREMKERGFKRWIDFETTATNLGLYFDRNRLLWPFVLWLMRGSTVAKLLATTAVLTMLITAVQPVIEYVTQYLTQYVTQLVKEIEEVEKDRFTIGLSDKMLDIGLQLSETSDFAEPKEVLTSPPAWNVPCLSIAQVPYNADELEQDPTGRYFSYTFYCRYINTQAAEDPEGDLVHYATSYDWGLHMHSEGLSKLEDQPTGTETTGTDPGQGELKVSDAAWVMVIADGEAIICARANVNSDGTVTPEHLPSDETWEDKGIAYVDRSLDFINDGLADIDSRLNVDTLYQLETLFDTPEKIEDIQGQIETFFGTVGVQNLTRLMLRTRNWREHYKVLETKGNYSYYRVIPENFPEENLLVQGTRTEVLPWVEGRNEEYHKYTVVVWLEGDDPECGNELMDGFIGLNFQIKDKSETYQDALTTPGSATDPTTG